MFIPIGSDIATKRFPWVCLIWSVISLTLFVSITMVDYKALSLLQEPNFQLTQTYHFAIVPAASNPWWKFVTYQFMHASWAHLISNLWYLFVFGWALECVMRRDLFFLMGLVCGALSVTSELIFQMHGELPIVGASGSVAAMMACLFVLKPLSKVRLLFLWIPLPGAPNQFLLPMRYLIYFWLLMQSSGLAMHLWVEPRPVAFATHLFGFFLGCASGLLIRLFLFLQVKKSPEIIASEHRFA